MVKENLAGRKAGREGKSHLIHVITMVIQKDPYRIGFKCKYVHQTETKG